jgi:hypothetical protein
MSITDIYKNIDQQLLQFFPKELVKMISDYYKPEYKPEYDPIKSVDNVLSSFSTLSHDGFDSFGPKSDLYDLYILYKLNGIKYVAHWHREDWFTRSEENYLYYIHNIVELKEFMKGSVTKSKIKFNRFLPRSRKFVMNDGFTIV